MSPGAVVADRFEIERPMGGGRRRILFRARDRQKEEGQLVALRLLRPVGAARREVERFVREAEVLAELNHPGLVGYVAHGWTPDGAAYLATEWVTGEDLKQYLLQGPLGTAEALELLRAAAAALGVWHGRGLVHGNLRSSRLLLRNAGLGQLALLVPGNVQEGLDRETLTRPGQALRALCYLAPEQVREGRALTPAVDVFALGCVLFECLTGAPPFAAQSAAGTLGRLLNEEAPRLSELRPELPEAIGALLSRMLARNPEDRPADGRALAVELGRLMLPEAAPEWPARGMAMPGASPGDSERRLVSVLLAVPPSKEETAGAGAMVTLPQEELEALLDPHGIRIDRLVDGSLLGLLDHGQGDAMEQAEQAARVALSLRQRLIGWTMGLLTEQCSRPPTVPPLETRTFLRERDAEAGGERSLLWLDEMTAGLLKTRFRVRRTEQGGWVLEGEGLR
ncbi:MAG TPA: serine/threonine-protein kinase [Polyangia bacterium]|nr:serine/threonine-protein kinase [Polyangia bacterium]